MLVQVVAGGVDPAVGVGVQVVAVVVVLDMVDVVLLGVLVQLPVRVGVVTMLVRVDATLARGGEVVSVSGADAVVVAVVLDVEVADVVLALLVRRVVNVVGRDDRALSGRSDDMNVGGGVVDLSLALCRK